MSNTVRPAEPDVPSDRADGASSLNLWQSSSLLWALAALHVTGLPGMKYFASKPTYQVGAVLSSLQREVRDEIICLYFEGMSQSL